MIKIIVENQEEKKYRISIDEVDIEKELVKIYLIYENYYVDIYHIDVTKRLLKKTFNDIPLEIFNITLFYPLSFSDLIEEIEIKRKRENNKEFQLSFKYSWDFEKWKKPYSIEELARVMTEVCSSYEDHGIYWVQEDEVISNGCHILITNYSNEMYIEDVINNHLGLIEEITEKANLLLTSISSSNSISSLFDFPEHVRGICEQYLIYFVQFLRNLGIEAEANLEQYAGKVLFSVTPQNRNVALEKLRQALDIYLQLPNELVNMTYNAGNLDPKVLQLVANLQHLNSQLMLSNAIIQTQQYTIESQQGIINQQQRFIDVSILQESNRLTSTTNEDTEEILGGLVSLKKYDLNGIEINIPNIYRWIKDKIGLK